MRASAVFQYIYFHLSYLGCFMRANTAYIYAYFDVLLTVHVSIFLVINQLNAQNLVL